MSGVFWEQDRQPNLCEAASGFTFSTINLLVAIPMAVVDLAVSSTLAVWSLILAILFPVLEAGQAGLTCLAELLGIDSLTVPAVADVVVPGLAIGLLAVIYAEHRGGTSVPQLASKYCLATSGLLWLAALYAASPAVPRLAVVSLALAFASHLPGVVVALAANFKPVSSTVGNSVLSVAGGLSTLLSLEGMLVAVVAAFGYPELLGGTHAADDDLMQWLSALPLCACVLVYDALKQQPESAGVSVDHVDGAPVTMNGSAVGIGGEDNSTAAAEPAAVATAAEEPAAAEAPPAADEQAAENAADETVSEVKDDQEASEAAPAEPTPVQPADETQPPPAAADEPTKEEEAAAAAAEVAPAEINKDDILLAKLRSRLSCVAGGLCGRLTALVGLLSGWLAALVGLPWVTISLVLTTAASHLLSAAAWSSLTGGNQLAFLLPVFTLVLPLLLERCGSRLSATWRILAGQLSGLAVAGLHYSLVTSVQAEDY